jgi:5-methylcytosine-specific restriction endonuclease McrA
MKYACPVGGCGRITNQPRCPQHTGNHTGWTPQRDRTAQARFRRALLTRAGHQCEACGNTTDLRACHTIPLHRGGTYDPANGQLLCRTCDKATDPHAR